MQHFNTSELAAELGTTPRTLRIFLRACPEYSNAGSGGRYDFTTADLPQLKRLFADWNKPKTERKARVKKSAGDQGLPWKIAMSKDPADIARVRRLSEERVDRLEAALRERGLHISQMNVSDWRARRVEALNA